MKGGRVEWRLVGMCIAGYDTQVESLIDSLFSGLVIWNEATHTMDSTVFVAFIQLLVNYLLVEKHCRHVLRNMRYT